MFVVAVQPVMIFSALFCWSVVFVGDSLIDVLACCPCGTGIVHHGVYEMFVHSGG